MQMNRYYTVGIVEDEVIDVRLSECYGREKGQSCRLFLSRRWKQCVEDGKAISA